LSNVHKIGIQKSSLSDIKAKQITEYIESKDWPMYEGKVKLTKDVKYLMMAEKPKYPYVGIST
jgi:hypothetical protein